MYVVYQVRTLLTQISMLPYNVYWDQAYNYALNHRDAWRQPCWTVVARLDELSDHTVLVVGDTKEFVCVD